MPAPVQSCNGVPSKNVFNGIKTTTTEGCSAESTERAKNNPNLKVSTPTVEEAIPVGGATAEENTTRTQNQLRQKERSDCLTLLDWRAREASLQNCRVAGA